MMRLVNSIASAGHTIVIFCMGCVGGYGLSAGWIWTLLTGIGPELWVIRSTVLWAILAAVLWPTAATRNDRITLVIVLFMVLTLFGVLATLLTFVLG